MPQCLTSRTSRSGTVDDDQPSNPESDEDDTTVPDLEVLDPDTDKTTGPDHDDTVNMHKNQ